MIPETHRFRFKARTLALLGLLGCLISPSFALPGTMTWSGDPGPWGADPMNQAVQTWNTYAYYGFHVPVYYSSGIPTAQANYRGSIGFGGQGNYRVAMHESAHWLGTGSVFEWDLHQRFGVWNGTYATNLRRAYDGPGERQLIYGIHYGPDGANFDSESVNGPRFVGMVGAKRRDMELEFGDQTVGIASGTYRLRHRVAVKSLDSLNATTEVEQVRQDQTKPDNDSQLWQVTLQEGTVFFTLQNVANGKYLDSLGATANGSPVGMTSLAGAPTDNQLWEIVQTDSFFFKIINKANGKGLDNLGASGDGDGVAQWDAAGNFSWNQHWTFLHLMAQTAPPAGVISQGRPVTSSSTEGTNFDNKGNNGVAGDRWTASDGSYPQWWRVDTGTVQPITRVEIDWFKGGNPSFQYQIEVSDNDAAWTVVANRTGNTDVGTTVDELTGVTGRFVRVTVTGVNFGGYFAAFHECRVFNESTPLKNLSQSRPTSANSEQAGNLAVNANDVDPVFTRWCSNSSGYPGWWQVDLGSVKQVNRAVIAWFDDDARSYQYRIEGSTDGTNFSTLANRTGNTSPYTTSDDFSAMARYVRIYVTGGSHDFPSIYDAQIFGATTLPPTNLAGAPSSGDINLSWTASPGATSYKVMRSTLSGGPYMTIANDVTGTSYTDSGASGATRYYYVVSAVGSAGEGDPSTEFSVNSPGTLAFWNFEDGVNGQDFTPTGNPVGSGGSTDIVNGILMRGYDNNAGPSWTSDVPPYGDSLAMNNSDNAEDGYVTEGALHDWSPTEWTIECTAFFEEVAGGSGFKTLIGRDGSSQSSTLADFYLQRNGDNGAFRVSIATVGGQRWLVDGDFTVQTNTWYAIAARSDGTTLSLWADDGSGYRQIGSQDISSQSVADNALPGSTLSWIFGRGWFDNAFVDRIDGRMDNIRFSNGVLGPDELIPLDPSLDAPTGLTATTAPESSVDLSWNPVTGAAGYRVRRSTSMGGPYDTITSQVSGTSFSDLGLTPGATYYYVVRAIDSTVESDDSAEAGATIWTAAEEWRFDNFETISNTGDSADDADPDGDGWDNGKERISGTDPNDRESRLRIASYEPSGDDRLITFPTVVGRRYLVLFSNSLEEDSWSPIVTDGTPMTEVDGTGGDLQVVDTDGNLHARRFYRVRVSEIAGS